MTTFLAGSDGRRFLATSLGAAAVLASAASAAAQDPNKLVFTPVARCVVLDTRVQGGALAAWVPRAFDVAGDLALQGGAANCGIPFGPATAAAIRLVPIDPPAYGTLKVWPFGGTVPSDGAVEFGPGIASSVTADLIVPMCNPAIASCTRDLIVRADYGGTHLVAEVAGYFSPSTTYQAGFGLTLDGTTFSVNPSTIQSRVSGSCPAGWFMQAIDAAGGVTCEKDDHSEYTAGFGLEQQWVTGETIRFTVNTSQIQRRVTGSCPMGIASVHDDGSVTCAPAILTGRRSDAPACPTERTFSFPEPFESTPVVVVTPNGLSGVTAAPNTYCVVDNVTTTSFQFCCYGQKPTYVNWMATRVR